jgi:hypothetical protein
VLQLYARAKYAVDRAGIVDLCSGPGAGDRAVVAKHESVDLVEHGRVVGERRQALDNPGHRQRVIELQRAVYVQRTVCGDAVLRQRPPTRPGIHIDHLEAREFGAQAGRSTHQPVRILRQMQRVGAAAAIDGADERRGRPEGQHVVETAELDSGSAGADDRAVIRQRVAATQLLEADAAGDRAGIGGADPETFHQCRGQAARTVDDGAAAVQAPPMVPWLVTMPVAEVITTPAM